MREALAAWLSAQRGDDASVVDLRRIATGHSRAMWRCEMSDASRYVVRIEQGGVFGTSGSDEFEMMRLAGALGSPVATVRWNEPTGGVIGQPFFVMDFVDSLAAAREDRTLPGPVGVDFIRRLDELHRLDWRAHSEDLSSRFLDSRMQNTSGATGRSATVAQIARWAGVYRSASDRVVPLLEEGEAWLRRHAPATERVAIVHGDPGPGNFLHDGSRVVALTDWEFAHLGDPMEDWVYVIAMRGARTMSIHEWRTLIRAEAGVEVTDADVRYWSAFNFFKGACANLTCLQAFAGPNPAPNMAIIGTALHQTFLRNLALLVANA